MKILSRPPAEDAPAQYTVEELREMAGYIAEEYEAQHHIGVLAGMLGTLMRLGHIEDFNVFHSRGYATAYVKLKGDNDIHGFTI